jgi:predicted acyltransferase
MLSAYDWGKLPYSLDDVTVEDIGDILNILPIVRVEEKREYIHVLGFWAGKLISETKDLGEKIQKLFIFGTIIMFIGFLIDYGFPINKKIWSSSFVLTTCGLASLLLGLLIWIIDIKEKKRWSVFFESFGVNPMFVYVVSFFLIYALYK